MVSRGHARPRPSPDRHVCPGRRGSRAFPPIPGSAELFPGSPEKIPVSDATGIDRYAYDYPSGSQATLASNRQNRRIPGYFPGSREFAARPWGRLALSRENRRKRVGHDRPRNPRPRRRPGPHRGAADPAILLAAVVAPARRRAVGQARKPHPDRRLQIARRPRLSRRSPARASRGSQAW